MRSFAKILAILMLLGFTGGALTACGDTWRGAGQDVEDIGEDMQHSF